MPSYSDSSSAVERRRSPRKKNPITNTKTIAHSLLHYVDSTAMKDEKGVARKLERDSESEDDELPDLATLILGRGRGSRNRSTGGSARSTNTRRGDAVSQQESTGSRSRSKRGGLQEADYESTSINPQPKAILHPNSNCNSGSGLGLRLHSNAPCLLPPGGAVESVVMTSQSSRQQIQRRRLESPVKAKSPVKGDRAVSPIKNSNGSRGSSHKETSNGSRNNGTTSLQLPHVNALLLPLKDLNLNLTPGSDEEESSHRHSGEDHPQCSKPPNSRSRRLVSRTTTAKSNSKSRGAMYVLHEAACKDDDDDEDEDEEEGGEEEGEFTDLSGFIVDDDAEISFHGSGSGSDSESENPFAEEWEAQRRRKKPRSPIKKWLVRGRSLSDGLRSLDLEKEGGGFGKRQDDAEDLVDRIAALGLGVGDRKTALSRERTGEVEVEVVDLTSSPVQSRAENSPAQDDKMPKRMRHVECENKRHDTGIQKDLSASTDSDDSKDQRNALLRFSPPTRKSPIKIEKKKKPTIPLNNTNLNSLETSGPTTPPQTPPASPTKLRSPSKLNSPSKNLLLSPSKRGTQVPQSPHRQSIDAFWSSEVINEWNDQYSPKKPPLTTSPRKKWKIWEDEGDDSGSESPCESPARRIGSPEKKVTSPSKKVMGSEKKAAALAKKGFDEEKVGLAQDLFRELDEKVSNGKLAQLSQSTGGVKIVWSKNLRSTAGRANWRRTVTKTSTGSPVKDNPGRAVVEAGDVRVQHYASIELAEKVIDNEERLVNTLAHEYCHLANFMVSGVRDQPHGASFKRW